MNEVLSRDEIDALLFAISDGEKDKEDFYTPRSERDARKIRIYDFKRPDRFSKDQVRSISIMHETFARQVSLYLSNALRSPPSYLQVASVDQTSYECFIRSIPTPTTLATLKPNCLSGDIVIEIDRCVSFAALNLLFDGDGIFDKSKYNLTEMETASLKYLLNNMLQYLKQSWEHIGDFTTNIKTIETNPQFVQLVPPSEMVVIVTFEAKIGEEEGQICIVYPYSSLKDISQLLSSKLWFSKNVTSKDKVKSINHLPIEITAELFNRSFTIGEVNQWSVNDILYPTHKKSMDMAALFINKNKICDCDIIKNDKSDFKSIKLYKDDYANKEINGMSNNAKEPDNQIKDVLQDFNQKIKTSLQDVQISISVELGRAKKSIKDILAFGEGTIIELDKLAGEPTDIFANGVLIAQGEVVVIDEDFGVRITKLIDSSIR